jgi:hypothetical protein
MSLTCVSLSATLNWIQGSFFCNASAFYTSKPTPIVFLCVRFIIHILPPHRYRQHMRGGEGVPGCHNLVPFLNPLLLPLSRDCFSRGLWWCIYICNKARHSAHTKPIEFPILYKLGSYNIHQGCPIWCICVPSGPQFDLIGPQEYQLILFYFGCLVNDAVSRQYP